MTQGGAPTLASDESETLSNVLEIDTKYFVEKASQNIRADARITTACQS